MSGDAIQPKPISPAEFLADPHACLARRRAEHWWAPIAGMSLIEVVEYQAVRDLLAAPGQFGAYDGGYFQDVMRRNPALSDEHVQGMQDATSKGLINLDGEEHDRLRALVAQAFTPRSVAALTPFLDGLAGELAGQLAPGDDFMGGFGRTFPALVLCELLGIPPEDHAQFIAWIDVLEVGSSPAALLQLDREGSERVARTQREYAAYNTNLVASRRAEPRDDLVSRLVHEAGDRFESASIVQLVNDIMFAGNATTRNALGLMVQGLASHHADVWEAVAAEPERAAAVVEESLRLFSPAPGPVRRACTRFEYRNRTFEEGEVAALSTWSANRDEGFWGANSGEFDASRAQSGAHLTFSHGSHFCLGAALAREELRAALVALTRRLTNVEVLAAPPMQPLGGIYGPMALRIGFDVRG